MVLTTRAQDCPGSDDRINELKGFQTESLPCMYSGFIQVNETLNSHLFYWFFRDEALSETAPLVLWLNGGPGASSQLGSLLENGPLRLIKTEEGVRGDVLKGQAWTAEANMLYLDQPVGVGYSFGSLVYKGQAEVRKYSIAFLKGFFEKYPEMADRPFFVTGESYGGKYEPNIADAILEYNKANPNKKINLKGMIVGNGYVDPLVSFRG